MKSENYVGCFQCSNIVTGIRREDVKSFHIRDEIVISVREHFFTLKEEY